MGNFSTDLPQIGRVTLRELRQCLLRGWWDFVRAPHFGIFFAAVYVLGGLALVQLGAGAITWTLVLSLGFPLVAPFAAVGLYEVSRRIEAEIRLDWREILGVVAAERRRQIPWLGAVLIIAFLFWMFLAHMIFALFMGLEVLTNATKGVDLYLTTSGLRMLAAEVPIGGLFAYLMFSFSVVSLPLLLEREVDFVSAMILSVRTVRANPGTMSVWALTIAVLLVAGMMPMFLGLFVVLPVLGHASWHLYRRALYQPV